MAPPKPVGQGGATFALSLWQETRIVAGPEPTGGAILGAASIWESGGWPPRCGGNGSRTSCPGAC